LVGYSLSTEGIFCGYLNFCSYTSKRLYVEAPFTIKTTHHAYNPFGMDIDTGLPSFESSQLGGDSFELGANQPMKKKMYYFKMEITSEWRGGIFHVRKQLYHFWYSGFTQML
jgi:hypothetical protein